MRLSFWFTLFSLLFFFLLSPFFLYPLFTLYSLLFTFTLYSLLFTLPLSFHCNDPTFLSPSPLPLLGAVIVHPSPPPSFIFCPSPSSFPHSLIHPFIATNTHSQLPFLYFRIPILILPCSILYLPFVSILFVLHFPLKIPLTSWVPCTHPHTYVYTHPFAPNTKRDRGSARHPSTFLHQRPLSSCPSFLIFLFSDCLFFPVLVYS